MVMKTRTHHNQTIALFLVAILFSPAATTSFPGGTIEEAYLSSDPTMKSICQLTDDPSTCESAATDNPDVIFDTFDVTDPANLKKLHSMAHPSVRHVCHRADDPDLCAFAYYLSGGTNDVAATANLVLDRLLRSAALVGLRDQREAVQLTDGLRRDDGERWRVYATCGEQFLKAAAEMVLAEEMVRRGDLERAMFNVNQTIAHNDYCDEILHHATYNSGIPINDAGMVKLITAADALHLYASNCMALLEMLKSEA